MPVVFVAASQLPTPFALFTMHGFLDEATGREHVVLSLGDVADGAPVLGRLHSECLTGDALFSQRCDCGSQLEAALQAIAREGRGILLYLRQDPPRTQSEPGARLMRQDDADLSWLTPVLEAAVAGLRAELAVARPGPGCRMCAVADSCPADPRGAEVRP